MGRSAIPSAIILALLVLMVACESEQPLPEATSAAMEDERDAVESSVERSPVSETFELSSGAFGSGEEIPTKYSCDGEDISPPLSWDDFPEETRSFALIFDDPDAVEVAGFTWVHWVLFDLPGDLNALPENVSPDAELTNGGLHGQNSWERLGYGGPCPPRGTHRYFFKLYAIDTILSLDAGATKERLLEAMEGHVLAQAELMGSYTR